MFLAVAAMLADAKPASTLRHTPHIQRVIVHHVTVTRRVSNSHVVEPGFNPPPSTTTTTTATTTKMPMKQILIPASAPTSPAATRSKTDRHPPVTPQRVSQSVRAVSSSSPYTPATTLSTPYTPFSLRSLSSSSNGSNLATPASAICRRRLSLSLSPEVNTNSKSLADIAENWRTRANENGIKVASGDDSQYQGKCI